MSFKIPVRGGEEIEALVYQKTDQISEAEMEKFLESIGDLVEMSRFEIQYLRRQIEVLPPYFTELLKKFLTLELAKVESLMIVSKELSAVIKEFWAAKYNNKGGDA